jgi:hypothetical protein
VLSVVVLVTGMTTSAAQALPFRAG